MPPPPPPPPPSDSDVANALQNQYRQEFLQRQARKNARSRASAPPASPTSSTAPPRRQAEIDLSGGGGAGPGGGAGGGGGGGSNLYPASPYVRATPSTTMYPPMDFNNNNSDANFNTNISTVEDDEAYARRLQDEFNNSSPSTPRAFGVPVGGAPDLLSSDVPLTSTSRSTSTYTTATALDEDARMAQQLQDEELARRMSSMHLQQQQQQQQQSSVFLQTQQQSSFLDERANESSLDSGSDPEARRIAQEMDDAEMAQRLSLYEQEAASRRQVMEGTNQNNADTSRRSRNAMMRTVASLLCCGAVIAVPLLFLTGVFDTEEGSLFGDIFPNADDFIDTDPFAGDNTLLPTAPNASIASNSMRWDNNGNGLGLEILNAMDDSWQTFLRTAVQNWDEGAPIDSLTLTTTRVDYEVECEPQDGYLKVCNANYGDTKWRGLNELALNRRTNLILQSVAKLNEYYLDREGDAQRLYTLCHELGHGFGLPHWDEDFNNADLGNCMDYTSNPRANMLPDESNFLFLAELYGGEDVTSTSSAIARVDAGAENVEDEKGKGNKNEGRGNRGGRHRMLRSSILTSSVLSNINISNNNNNNNNNNEDDYHLPRILQADEHAEVHYIVVDDDTAIVRQYLLA